VADDDGVKVVLHKGWRKALKKYALAAETTQQIAPVALDTPAAQAVAVVATVAGDSSVAGDPVLAALPAAVGAAGVAEPEAAPVAAATLPTIVVGAKKGKNVTAGSTQHGADGSIKTYGATRAVARSAGEPVALAGKLGVPVATVGGNPGVQQKVASPGPVTQTPAPGPQKPVPGAETAAQPDSGPIPAVQANFAAQLATAPVTRARRRRPTMSTAGSPPGDRAAGLRAGKKAPQRPKPTQMSPVAQARTASAQQRLAARFQGADQLAPPVVEEATGLDRPAGNVGPQIAAVEMGSVEATVRPTAPSEVSAASAIPNQVAEAFLRSGARQGERIVVQLNPPELGKIRVTLNARGKDVHGVLEVDEPGTLKQFQREAPAIASRLAEAGVQLKRMDMSLTDSGSPDTTPHSHAGGDANAGGAWGEQAQQAPEDPYGADELPASEASEPTRTVVEDNSINIWM
jgi:flagellar hook-length control protein FliK